MNEKYSKAELTAMEKQVHEVLDSLDNMSEEKQKQVVNQIVYGDQIEIGEYEEANFVVTQTELGLPLKRKGRIPFEEVLKIAPILCDYLKGSINPKQSIKRIKKCSTEEGKNKLNESVKTNRSIRKKDKKGETVKNEEMFKEQDALEKAGLRMNKNTCWSIYKIMRGRKRAENFEEDGIDIELITLQNSFLSDEELEGIYERRSELYEDD